MSKIRNDWLVLLAKMSTPSDPVKAFKAMQAFLPLLADMPDEAFTSASLEAVAMAPQALHIRTLREVKEPLAAWWREHKPRPKAIAAPAEPERPDITPEERAAVAQQLRDLLAGMKMPEPQRPVVRSHVIPAEVLAEARAALMARRRA